MNLDIKHFKNELSDYYYLKQKIGKIRDMMLELETIRGIRAVQYDKEVVQGSSDPLIMEMKRLEEIDQAEYLDQEYAKYMSKMNRIIDFIKSTEYGESIKKIHCTGESTYAKEAAKLYMNEKTLKRRVNRAIFEYLEKEAGL